MTSGVPIPTVLIIEDNPDDAALLEAAIASGPQARFRSETVPRLDAALERLRQGGVDIVLLDLHLPDSDGLDGLAQVLSVTRAVPVVILTGLDDERVALGALQAGAQEYMVKGTADPRTVGRTLRHAMERHRLLADLELTRQREARLATVDPLTGIPNRTLFFDRLALTVERAARYGERFAVAFLDCDGFRQINELCGHPAGDEVLVQMAARLSAAIRKSDTVARLAGDQFVLLMERLPSRERAEELVAELAQTAGGPVVVEGRSLELGVSWGLAFYPDDGRDPDTLVRVADAAMYRRKLGVRDQESGIRDRASGIRPDP